MSFGWDSGEGQVAISPTVSGHITYDPPLPAGRLLAQRAPAGAVIKALAVYSERFRRVVCRYRAGA